MKSLLRRRTLCAFLAVVLGHTASAQICTDGACFRDLGATGEINLGRIRGGLAVLDYDGDGFQDLVIADSVGRSNHLFRNVPDPNRPGNRTFQDVTAGSRLDDAEGTNTGSFGVVAADYDNDGDTDLFMTGVRSIGPTSGILYRNDAGVFTNVSESSGIRPSPAVVYLSAAWSDYDLDGFVDLTIASELAESQGLRLLRNQGDGTFLDVSGILPAVSFVRSYAILWVDYDADGWPDLVVPATSEPFVSRNVADGLGGRRFIDATAASGFTVLGPAPMGIVSDDYDNDSDFDIVVSDALASTIYENQDGFLVRVYPFLTDFSWGLTFLDVDNDADLDHYQCGRYGSPRFDSLVRNLGDGTWDDISAVLNGINAGSQHTVEIDFNNDGRQDLVTINPGLSPPANISVLENISTTPGHWLTLHLKGDGASINGDAIGAIVRVTAGGRVQMRQVFSGSSTTATEDMRLHFGLGDAAVVDQIEVVWPADASQAARTNVYSGPFAADQIMDLAPQIGACCVCAGAECQEMSSPACAIAEGAWVAQAVCAEVDCAVAAPGIASAPTAASTAGPQNRFLSIEPGNRGRRTAVCVTLASLHHPDPPNPAVFPPPDFTSFETQTRWLGSPHAFEESSVNRPFQTAAALSCEPHFDDWGRFDVVHVYGAEIVPSSVYEVQVIDVTCDDSLDEESRYSAPLSIATARWGDVAPPYQQTCSDSGCTPCTAACRTQPNALDVTALVNRFKGLPGSPEKRATRLQPNVPNPVANVNALDISVAVDAFRGGRYPYAGFAVCPP